MTSIARASPLADLPLGWAFTATDYALLWSQWDSSTGRGRPWSFNYVAMFPFVPGYFVAKFVGPAPASLRVITGPFDTLHAACAALRLIS